MIPFATKFTIGLTRLVPSVINWRSPKSGLYLTSERNVTTPLLSPAGARHGPPEALSLWAHIARPIPEGERYLSVAL